MSQQTLDDLLQKVGNPVDLLRNSQIGPYLYPVVPPEFTNWRGEQRAWQETCVLFNQCYHMTDLHIEGSEALQLLSDLAINSFAQFSVGKAKQFVACNHDGFVIGDAILFYLAENSFSLVGRPSAINWVQYHAETGGYDVSIERDERAAARQGPIARKYYRYQVQGPNAPEVMRRVIGEPMPEIRFFNMAEIAIARRKVRALRHGMAGQPGWELFGPWGEGDAVKAAIVEAGRDLGLRKVGSKAYSMSTLESGWIPSPLPAVYTGEKTKAYREWLPATWYEATASLGGSFYSDDIADYYLTPQDLGYGPILKFDHDFIGREALEKRGDDDARTKVTLVWNGDDVAKIYRSIVSDDGPVYKYIDMPSSNYSTLPYDRVLRDGRPIGISTFSGCSSNERAILSLAILATEHAKPGTEVTLVWGEEGGGSLKPTVEPHVQTEIRATVGPAPYSRAARTGYRPA